MSLRVVARIVAVPDKIDELRALLLAMVEPSRTEAGCRSYELLHNMTDPTDFTFVQEWDDEAAYDAHMSTDHFKQVTMQLSGMVKQIPDIRRYDVLG